MTESSAGDDADPAKGGEPSQSTVRETSTTNRKQAALGCGGVVCLIVAILIAVLAPAIGGLSGIASPEDLTFAASQPIPLDAHRRVTFDVNTYAGQHLQSCKITGPNHFSLGRPFVDVHDTFTTKGNGDYYIACEGGDVTVHNDVSGNPAADIREQHGNNIRTVLFILAGIFGVIAILVLVASGRVANDPSTTLADSPDGSKPATDA